MQHAQQQQTVTVDRGLFLVRYTAAEDQDQPPRVKLSVDPSSKKDISFILYPDQSEPILWQPDTCLVVRAMAAGKLAVQVIPLEEGSSTAATVRIEPLSQGKAVALPATLISRDLGGLRILGHLTGLGDVAVKADEWLGGPSSPMRIEGIAVNWPEKPSDLQIRYAVKTSRPMPTSGQAVELGSFAGTRGRAMPVVGLMLELTGPAAAHFQFCVEAIFLGSPATRFISNRVVASGPTGREPLVGLRLSLKSVDAVDEFQTRALASRREAPADRVRVFRSRPKSNQAANA